MEDGNVEEMYDVPRFPWYNTRFLENMKKKVIAADADTVADAVTYNVMVLMPTLMLLLMLILMLMLLLIM